MWALLLVAAGLAYPPAAKGTVVDEIAGRKVADPYRWMEDLDSPAVQRWIDAENSLTYGYLSKLPQREAFKKRLTELWNYPRTEVPEREAGQLYFRRNSGLQKQSVLYRAPQTVVLDPNALWPDGAVAMGQWKVSPDGRWLAYTAAPGGSDVRDVHVRDLRSGKDLKQIVPRIKFSGLSWTKDARGFVYERFKGTEKAARFAAANTFHQVWYHPLHGTDRLVFERPGNPRDVVGAEVSDDGRWLFLTAASGTTNQRLWIADLADRKRPRLGAQPQVVAPEEDAIHEPLGVEGGKLLVYTTYQAPNGRIVAAAIGDPDRAHWETVVPETRSPIVAAILVAGRIAVVRLVDVQSRLEVFDARGADLGEVKLPEAGSVLGLSGKNDGDEVFFEFTSYLRPRTVYRLDIHTGALQPFHEPKSPFDASRYETRALFYPSKDGTRIPIFITLRKGARLDGAIPTILYGYGGFNIALQPAYSATIAGWLDQGGAWAVANLRGGSEYGQSWHEAGMREKKQNVFDDFIAAAEFLERDRYTSPGRLAIRGGSNGGLLVGAVMIQRPELFAVALPAVGVMDMMRYQKFTGGALWVREYGSSDEPQSFPYLLGYSPLHNLRPGMCYPATLVTTADRDDRVVPSHSFKFTATLQADQGCDRPVLIRVEKAGSHGYRPLDRVIAEAADQLAFAMANLERASEQHTRLRPAKIPAAATQAAGEPQTPSRFRDPVAGHPAVE